MSIKFLILGGGGILGLWGGECRFYFYGRADFSDNWLLSEFNGCWKIGRACGNAAGDFLL